MAAPHLQTRITRDLTPTLGALMRAMSDPAVEIERVAPADVLAATHERSSYIGLRGAYESALSIPIQTLLRDLTATGGAPSGGALLGAAKIDPQTALRPFSVITDAGLRVVDVPRGTGTTGVPFVATPPAAGWMAAENDTAPTSDAVFGLVQPVPRRLALQFFVSWRLMRQGGDSFDGLIRAEIGNAIGRAIDAGALAGTGASGQPQGLATLSGVNTQAGASLAHAGILAMRRKAIDGGVREDQLRWVGTAAVQETLGARERSTGGGRFVWDTDGILGRPAHATSAGAASTLVCGDFSQATLYILGPLDIVVDRRPLSTSGKLSFVANMWCDLAVPRPATFSVASSIT